MFLIVLSINSSLNKWLTLRVGPGIWFLGIIGAFLVICACTGRKRKKEKLIYEWDVINFDPVLPIRCNKLKITQEYSLELELTCEEFEWTNVEGIIAEVQMVKNTQNIETLARFVTFSKFRDKKCFDCSSKYIEIHHFRIFRKRNRNWKWIFCTK